MSNIRRLIRRNPDEIDVIPFTEDNLEEIESLVKSCNGKLEHRKDSNYLILSGNQVYYPILGHSFVVKRVGEGRVYLSDYEKLNKDYILKEPQ